MPRNSRKNLPGQYYHIMSQGINKEYIFDKDEFKKKYIKIMYDKINEKNIEIIAYCAMDNHVHVLMKVEKAEEMCKFMQQVNTTYAKFYNKVNNRVGYVFRNRYLAKIILDENQLKKCIVYIHRNPVVAKLVEKEYEYKFSSYNQLQEQYKIDYKYKDNELTEFDDFEEKVEINLSELLEKYFYLKENEKIMKLNVEGKISERKLAEIFNKTRHQIRKILNK